MLDSWTIILDNGMYRKSYQLDELTDSLYDKVKDGVKNLTRQALKVFLDWYVRNCGADNYDHLTGYIKERLTVCKGWYSLMDWCDKHTDYNPFFDDDYDDDMLCGALTAVRNTDRVLLECGDGTYVIVKP